MDLIKFKEIDTIILDVDGVLTDGKLICTPEGEIWRNMQAKDGYALQSWIRKGGKMALITNGGQHGVLEKLKHFGVTLIYLEVKDKSATLLTYAEEHNITLSKALYMGDDIADYGPISLCGIGACPADAVHEIKQIATYISPLKGGQGCVRDVIEKVMRVQDTWFVPKENYNKVS